MATNARPAPEWIGDLATALPPLLTYKESALAARCSIKTIRRRVRSGLLETCTHGGIVRIPRASLLRLLGAATP
jgi:hypothetical protein